MRLSHIVCPPSASEFMALYKFYFDLIWNAHNASQLYVGFLFVYVVVWYQNNVILSTCDRC